MGKWCEVKCNCSNRVPVGPMVAGRRDFACGHPDGTLYEVWPGYLVQIGEALDRAFSAAPDGGRAFPIIRRIADRSSFTENADQWADEYLALDASECRVWRAEIGELIEVAAGRREIPLGAAEEWRRIWTFRYPLAWWDQPFERFLEDGLKLCDACIESGNPVEFYL